MGIISWMLLLAALPALFLSIVPVSEKISAIIAKTAVLAVFALSLQLISLFDVSSGALQFVEKASWISELGINYEVGVDGISLPLVFLTAIASLLIVFLSSGKQRLKGYLSLFLFLEFALLGVFVALDLVLFFVFFELMLLPSFLLMNGWGGASALRASIRFVLFTAIASALMLCSIIYLGWLAYDQSGQINFSLLELSENLNLSPEVQSLLFLGFFLAFVVKTPFAPFHTWLPDAYTQAPSALTAFMAALMAKAGMYGLIRFNLTLFPGALKGGLTEFFENGFLSETWLGQLFLSVIKMVGGFEDFLIWVLALGVVYSGLIAWSQRNVKTLFAYSSISHLALCGMAVVICSANSITAAVFFMFTHGLVALGLFLSFGMIGSRVGSFEIVELKGLIHRMPRASVVFFFFLLAAIALPLSANFVAEFLVLISIFAKYPFATIVAASSVVIGAVYMLSLFRRVVLGPVGSETPHYNAVQKSSLSLKDLSLSETAAFIPLIVFIIALGIFPNAVLKRIEASSLKLERRIFDLNFQDPTSLQYDQGFASDQLAGVSQDTNMDSELSNNHRKFSLELGEI